MKGGLALVTQSKSETITVRLNPAVSAALQCLDESGHYGVPDSSIYLVGIQEYLLDRACDHLKVFGRTAPVTKLQRQETCAALRGLRHLGVRYRWDSIHEKLDWRRKGELDWHTYEEY